MSGTRRSSSARSHRLHHRQQGDLLTPGTRLGRYEIVRTLGEGGMGTVAEAVLHGPAGFQKRVALKQLRHGGEGLVHEAKLGGLLQHPHLVEVYALEQVEETWLCAMELISGGSLGAYAPLPSRAVVEAGLHIARGLAHAHEEVGLVHLDLKPANLLLHHGMVKVADLGISHARGFAPGGGLKGTPDYMSPEHRRGEPVDARSDIFALGVVLIELATGAPGHSPTLVPWLEPLLSRCLAEHPDQRFPDMRAVAAALREVEVSGPGLADLSVRREPRPESTGSATVDTFLFEVPPTSPEPPRTNIGPDADHYVGRAMMTADLLDQLRTPGLVTLKGIGGLGKTRLARRAAGQWIEQAPQREAWFADLSSATSSLEVIRGVADALGVVLSGEEPDALCQQLGWALAGRGDMVLVLDNFEQVTAAAPLLVAWRAQAPQLRMVVTSREALRVDGELVLSLQPLSEQEAVELLMDRARARGHDVSGDPDLAELARRLDCLPLALELAAGRLGLLKVRALIDRMNERFALLRSRDRTVSARQATLRGALDWSWDLLSDEERAAFAQCSVFGDGFTVEAAEQVIDVQGAWALDVVEALLERSLLHTRSDGRLGMYESTRAYAAEKLNDPYEAQERQAAFFAAEGNKARADRRVGSLVRELENLLKGCRTALIEGWPASALGCLAGATQVVIHRGPVGPVLELAGRVVGLPELSQSQRAQAHLLAAELSAVVGQTAVATLHFERAVELATADSRAGVLARVGLAAARRLAGELDASAEQLDLAQRYAPDPWTRGFVDLERGVSHYLRGDLDKAAACFEAIRALGARPPHPAAAEALSQLGHIHADRGEPDIARGLYRRALAVYRSTGDRRYEAATLTHLGNMDLEQGRYEAAERAYNAAITMQAQSGNRRREAVSRSNLGSLYMGRGRLDLARTCFERALHMHQELGNRRSEGLCIGNIASLDRCEQRLTRARRGYTRARDIAAGLGLEPLRGIWQGELGLLALEEERLEDAATHLADAVTAVAGRMAAHGELYAVLLAEAEEALGRGSADLFDVVEASRARGPTPFLVQAFASLARAAARRGEAEDAHQWLAQAQVIVAELPPGGVPHSHDFTWAQRMVS